MSHPLLVGAAIVIGGWLIGEGLTIYFAVQRLREAQRRVELIAKLQRILANV